MDVKLILEILLRRRWTIIQAFLVVFVVVALVTFQIKPMYKSTAVLYYKEGDSLSSVFSSLLSDIGLDSFNTILSDGDEINDKVELAKTSPILDEVIRRLQLRDGKGDLLSATRFLNPGIAGTVLPTPRVRVQVVEDTSTFSVTALADDPLKAQYIASTLAQVFIDFSSEENVKEAKSAQAFVTEQIKTVKDDYEKALKKLSEYQKREEVIDLPHEIQIAIAKMAELYTNKTDAAIDIKETEARIATLREQLAEEMELSASPKAISTNPYLEKLLKDLSSFRIDLTEALEEKTQSHPDVIVINKKISEIEQSIASEMEIYQKTSMDMASLEQTLSSYVANLEGINGEIEGYRELLLALPDKAVDLAMLQLAVRAGEQIYETLLDNQFQIGILETMSLSDVSLIEPARLPNVSKPTRPKTLINLIVGAILGMISGVALAFLFEFLDDTLKTHEDVTKSAKVTFLGNIPRFKYLRKHLISEADPRDSISEMYRTVRNSLQFATLDSPAKSVLITSAGPSEGKSTTSTNLAISFAREGKRTLVVDADLRKPGLHRLFHLSSVEGVTTILSKEADIESCIQETSIENLFLLASGPIPPDPGRIIESEKMKRLIESLSEKFDVIVLDSPPALVVNDAINIAKIVDATILVLESNKITHHALRSMLDLFENAKVKPTGIVLNKFRIGRVGYYYRYYKSYYAKKRYGT